MKAVASAKRTYTFQERVIIEPPYQVSPRNVSKLCSTMSQEVIKSERKVTPLRGFEYQFGAYRVCRDELTLKYRGAVLPLAPKVVKTLIVLLDNAGRFVSKDELLQSVWDGSIVEEANLSQNIYMLRRQFEATSNETFIETLPKRGYRFTQPVTKHDLGVTRPGLRVSASLVLVGALIACIFAAIVIRLGMADKRVALLPAPLPQAAEKADALGWYYWRGTTEADLKQSVHDFRLVVNAAPQSPVGYAGEAVAYAKLADIWEGSPSGLVASLAAEKLSQRAVSLDHTSAIAHAAKGFVEFDLDGDNRAAADDLKQAVVDEPDLAVAHLWYGAILLWQGNLGLARSELQRASNLDVTLPSINYLLALDYYMSRDYENAIAYAKLDKGDFFSSEAAPLLLAAAHEEAKQYPLAIHDIQNLAVDPSNALAASGTLAHVYASMGQQTRAGRELQAVELLSEKNQDYPLLVALAYSANGRPNEAFAWLGRMPLSDRTLFALDPRLDLLRHDRRFARWIHG